MNPDVLAAFAALRSLLIAGGAAMVALNLGHTQTYALVMQVSGSVMVVGPLLWAVFEKLVTLKNALAKAVQAGINLTVSGKAITDSGHVISQFSAEAESSTPPKLVTKASASEIIKEFAPSSIPASPSQVSKS